MTWRTVRLATLLVQAVQQVFLCLFGNSSNAGFLFAEVRTSCSGRRCAQGKQRQGSRQLHVEFTIESRSTSWLSAGEAIAVTSKDGIRNSSSVLPFGGVDAQDTGVKLSTLIGESRALLMKGSCASAAARPPLMQPYQWKGWGPRWLGDLASDYRVCCMGARTRSGHVLQVRRRRVHPAAHILAKDSALAAPARWEPDEGAAWRC